jgi:hypothetical protein
VAKPKGCSSGRTDWMRIIELFATK